MSREERERLHDILAAIDGIRGHATQADDAAADLVRDAILYRLLVIGEAVKSLPREMLARHPEIDWRGIGGLRDLMAHEYFRIEQGRVDEIVRIHLDPLERAVGVLLTRIDQGQQGHRGVDVRPLGSRPTPPPDPRGYARRAHG